MCRADLGVRRKSPRARKCDICGQPMRKNGRTGAGAQRWKCIECAITHSFSRDDQTQQATFAAFIDYLLGKSAQYEVDNTSTGRSARRRFAWWWNVATPPLAVTGEIYDQLFIDGIYLGYDWVLLTAVNERGQVVAGQWATAENSAAYTALLAPLPPPMLITSRRGRRSAQGDRRGVGR